MRRRIQMTCNKSVSLPGRHRGTPLHKPFNLVSLNCLVFLNHFYFKYVPNRKEKSRMTSWLLLLLGSIDFLCAHWNNIWQLEKKEANWTEEGTNVAKDRKLNIIQSYCPVSGNKCVKTTKFITVSSLSKNHAMKCTKTATAVSSFNLWQYLEIRQNIWKYALLKAVRLYFSLHQVSSCKRCELPAL